MIWTILYWPLFWAKRYLEINDGLKILSLKSNKRMERNFLWSSSKGRWKLGSYRMDQRESNTRNSKEFCISKSPVDERWWRLHFSIHCHSKGLFKFTLKYLINFCLVYRSKIRYWAVWRKGADSNLPPFFRHGFVTVLPWET